MVSIHKKKHMGMTTETNEKLLIKLGGLWRKDHLLPGSVTFSVWHGFALL